MTKENKVCEQKSKILRFLSSPLWIAAFTAVLMVANIQLCSITKTMKDISLINQRAYIHFKTISGAKVIDPQSKKATAILFDIVWENSGTTPTKKARSSSHRRFRTTELPKDFGFEDLGKIPKKSTVIGPKQTVSSPLVISIDDLIRVQKKELGLFFYGLTVYKDVFEGTPIRLTEYCREIINVRSRKTDLTDPSEGVGFDIVSCVAGRDCYDEDCPDYQAQIKDF